MSYWGDFGSIALLLVVSLLVGLMMVMLPQVLSRLKVIPRRPDPVKLSTYECGTEPIGTAWVRFNFRYYFFILLFLIFDIEVVFLYPWAVAYRKLALFGLIEMLIFIAILIVGYFHAWKKGALEWK